jgi:hypothetical protein
VYAGGQETGVFAVTTPSASKVVEEKIFPVEPGATAAVSAKSL